MPPFGENDAVFVVIQNGSHAGVPSTPFTDKALASQTAVTKSTGSYLLNKKAFYLLT